MACFVPDEAFAFHLLRPKLGLAARSSSTHAVHHDFADLTSTGGIVGTHLV
jgi:hypothetical protein